MAENGTAQAHEARITFLEQQSSEIKTTLQELGRDVRQLVVVMPQQAEDRAALKRAFEQISQLDGRLGNIERGINEAEQRRLREHIAVQQKAIDDSGRQRRALIMEIARNVIIIAAALFAYHLGVKLL